MRFFSAPQMRFQLLMPFGMKSRFELLGRISPLREASAGRENENNTPQRVVATVPRHSYRMHPYSYYEFIFDLVRLQKTTCMSDNL